MFYHGSTFELYAELIEPESMKDEYIKDVAKDGVRYIIVFDANKSIVKEGVLGNQSENSYISFNNHIDTIERITIFSSIQPYHHYQSLS